MEVGVVKWFNNAKGFGFISAEGSDTDIFAHYSVIEMEGYRSLKAGQKVVVAKPGTVMPSGAIIWAGELRGVASHGMLCSARELGLENAPAKKGILVLDDATPVGTPFKSLNLQ